MQRFEIGHHPGPKIDHRSSHTGSPCLPMTSLQRVFTANLDLSLPLAPVRQKTCMRNNSAYPTFVLSGRGRVFILPGVSTRVVVHKAGEAKGFAISHIPGTHIQIHTHKQYPREDSLEMNMASWKMLARSKTSESRVTLEPGEGGGSHYGKSALLVKACRNFIEMESGYANAMRSSCFRTPFIMQAYPWVCVTQLFYLRDRTGLKRTSFVFSTLLSAHRVTWIP